MPEGNRKDIGDVLSFQAQYLIPFFQREYSWRRNHWATLWEDVHRLISGDNSLGDHFFGPVVISERESGWGVSKQYIIIDGQQRITTVSLALLALRDVALAFGHTTLAAKINDSFLVHPHEEGLDKYRVLPRPGDREVYLRIVDGDLAATWASAPAIRSAYSYFYGETMKYVTGAELAELHAAGLPHAWAEEQPKARLEQLLAAITRGLDVVLIETSQENPFEIFESLNYKGEPLSEADLIRNNVFMGVGLSDQDSFNNNHWEPFESKLRNRSLKEKTSFFRNFLQRDGVFSQKGQTFVDYKARCAGKESEAQATMLSEWADYQLWVWDGEGTGDPEVDHALSRHAALGSGPTESLIMFLLNRWRGGELSKADLLDCLTDLDSFVLRRALTGAPTKWLDRWMPAAIAAARTSPKETLRALWFQHGWPSDVEFSRALENTPLYTSDKRKTRLILDELERSMAGHELVDLGQLSIEHVMPQKIGNGTDGAEWKRVIGDNWQEQHALWLHTLGNLTLTGYNTSLSNRTFEAKQNAPEWGLCDSRVALNRHFGGLSAWDCDAIRDRARRLSAAVCRLWPRPTDTAAAPDEVRSDPEPPTSAGRRWSKGDMLATFAGRSVRELSSAEAILGWGERNGGVSWGVGSFTVRVGSAGRRIGILYLSGHGDLWLQCHNIISSQHISASLRKLFADRLSEVSGIRIRPEDMGESYWLPLSTFQDDDSVAKFLSALDLVVGALV